MRKISLIIISSLFSIVLSGQKYSPYTIAYKTSGQLEDVGKNLVETLEQNSIDVIGQYIPANDNSRKVIVVSSVELKNAVSKLGGLTGFAGALRIGLIKDGNQIIVSYTTPEYWGNAYYRKDFDKVSNLYSGFHSKLKKAFSAAGNYIGDGFGSSKGISATGLQKYHYMVGMPYFYNTVKIGQFDSHQEAVNAIDNALKNGVKNVNKVYKLDYAGKNLALYGLALSGDRGESKFVPIIDINEPKHVAFLPYEILVLNNEVHMLHGRYRIALSFPDLTMRTFTKIMSTPGDIAELMKSIIQ